VIVGLGTGAENPAGSNDWPGENGDAGGRVFTTCGGLIGT
jgi:hypothetical protein